MENTLFKEGIVCNNIAYIVKGLFRIFHLNDGNEINTCFCKENSIISSFESFVNRTASLEYIQAIENVTVVTLSHQNLEKLYKLNDTWYSLRLLLTEKECLRLSKRVSLLSFETAMEKYKKLLKYQPEIIQ